VAPAGPLPPQQRARRIALLRRIYPDSGPGAPHFVPLLAVQIAADPTLSLKKLRRILDLIEQSRKIVIFVHVANTGDADALDVKIPPPKGFDLIAEPPVSNGLPPDPEYQQLAVIGDQPIVYQSHPTEDLDPGESVYFIFESEDSRPSAVHLSDIVPEADTTPAVNISLQLIVFGALLVGILVPLVIREIKNTPRDGTPPVAEDDE
jgi:hypothetical protein